MHQLIKVLIDDGEYRNIRKADPKKTNLPFFKDYITQTILKLEEEKIKLKDPSLIKEVESIISDAKLRVTTKEVSYNWVWEFSYQALSIFEAKYGNSILRDFSDVLKAFPNEIMIPTFAEQDFKHFIKTEGSGITFLGIRDTAQIVDGNPTPFSPIQFLNHDLLHYYLTMKGDHLLSLRDKHYYGWMRLHSEIKSKIGLLPQPQKRSVEFIYFYLLHEEFGIRDRMTYRFLNPDIGKMSEYAAIVLDHDLIRNHFDGMGHPTNVLRSELYVRAMRPYDFIEAFPNKIPQ
jgi:hypothetical protein